MDEHRAFDLDGDWTLCYCGDIEDHYGVRK